MKKYKNKIWIAILALLIFVIGCSVCASAASPACDVVIDDIKLTFTDDSGAPFIDKNNRTMVPLRTTMESYGCQVDWDQETYTASVKMDDTTVLVGIGNKYITVNGKKVEIDTEAKIVNSRTYLPIRAVLEAFGAKVDWENSTRTVDIKSPEYLAGQPRLVVPVCELNVKQYQYMEFRLGCRHVTQETLQLKEYMDDKSIVSGTWIYDEDTNEIVFRLFSFNPGSTTLRISFADPKYTDSVTITFNVTESPNKMQPYEGYPDIPDIGKLCGLKLVSTNEDDVVKLYEYDLSSYDRERFGSNLFLLHNILFDYLGFECYDTQKIESGDVIGHYYRNNKGDKVLVAASPASNGDINMVVGVFK